MNLKATQRNCLVKIFLDNKERYQLTDDIEIQISRKFNFNLREDAPSIGEVIDAENIPSGSLVLLHHNTSHETYHVQNLSKEDYNVYSVPTDMVFAFKNDKEWMAMPDFLITKRIFIPHEGLIEGIEPKKMPHHLYVVNGKIKNYDVEGKVVMSLINNDYLIEFFTNGREDYLIRSRCRDIIGLDNATLDKIKNGKLLIGNNLKDAKKI